MLVNVYKGKIKGYTESQPLKDQDSSCPKERALLSLSFATHMLSPAVHSCAWQEGDLILTVVLSSW